MQAPTIGRKVWYRPGLQDLIGANHMNQYGVQPLDSTVICVWGDRMVSLKVTDHAGVDYVRTSITLKQGDPDDKISEGQAFCEWMPYQTSQHAKAQAETQQEPAGAVATTGSTDTPADTAEDSQQLP